MICEHLKIKSDTQEIEKNLVRLGMEVEGVEDGVIEISIPANRGDCLSLDGLTRELGNSYGKKSPEIKVKEIESEFESNITVKVSAPKQCARYLAREIKDVNNLAKTPEYITKVLAAAQYNHNLQ